MTYHLMIMRDDNLILERTVTADQIIDLLTSTPSASEPEASARVKSTVDAAPIGTKKGKRKCGACGKLGHTARTCDPGAATVPPSKRNPLTEEMFDLVKQRKEDGDMVSSELALEFGVPVREVNIAIFSPNYKGYLKRRQRDNVL